MPKALDSGAEGPGPRVWDNRPMRAIQIRTIALCGAVAMLDGFDNQVVGVIAPLMREDLGLSQTELGAVFSITQIGATIGALLFGPIGDRFGRKPAILVSVLLMTAFTWATTLVPSFGFLLMVRFLAGVGLAGVLSSAFALTSEYAPARVRGAFVATVYAGYPTGAAIGGVTAAAILSQHDWRMVFYIGVVLGLLTVAAIAIWLPESIRFLISRGDSGQRVDRLLAQLGVERSDLPAPEQVPTERAPKTLAWSVFRDGLAPLTIILCLMNAFVAATTKIMVVWFPSILTTGGFTVSQGALAQAAFNLGGILPMIVAGWLIDRVGPLRVLVPAMLFNAVCLFGLSYAGSSFLVTLSFATLIGVCIGISAGGGPVLAAQLYPVAIRSTGIGWGVAASRVGSIVSPMIVALFLAHGTVGASVFQGLALSPLLAALAAMAFVNAGRKRTASAQPEATGPAAPPAKTTV